MNIIFDDKKKSRKVATKYLLILNSRFFNENAHKMLFSIFCTKYAYSHWQGKAKLCSKITEKTCKVARNRYSFT